jgi:hypothetical protein
MSRCLGTKRDKSPCTVTVEPPQNYCWWHDPANAEVRKQAASKGGRRSGKGRPQTEIARISARIEGIAEGVLSGEIDSKRGAIAGQLLNYVLGGLRIGLQAREQEELIERLEALEEGIHEKKRSRPWGA